MSRTRMVGGCVISRDDVAMATDGLDLATVRDDDLMLILKGQEDDLMGVAEYLGLDVWPNEKAEEIAQRPFMGDIILLDGSDYVGLIDQLGVCGSFMMLINWEV